MRILALTFLSIAAFASHAEDPRDTEIFGTPDHVPAPIETTPKAASLRASETAIDTQRLVDTLQIGGRLELYLNTEQKEGTSLGRSPLQQRRQAEIYFDTRPNKNLRSFLRTRFAEVTPSTPTSRTGVEPLIDELWLKWDLDDRMFFTAGKQYLKWGSARFWNPTDFTAKETRNPFELIDRRLGRSLIKIHLPMEKQAFNFYAIVQLEDAENNQDIGAAWRAELAFLGQGEAALTLQSRAGGAQRAGLDVNSAIGPIDAYIETALSRRETRAIYEGTFAPEKGRIPTASQDVDRAFTQVVVGLNRQWKFNDSDNLTAGCEFFYNELGYDDPKLELFAIANRQTEALRAGRRYAGFYLLAPMLGPSNETSVYFNAIGNLTDKTRLARLTFAWSWFKDASLEAYVSQCLGDYGELCFRVPEAYVVQGLPNQRTLITLGSGLSVRF